MPRPTGSLPSPLPVLIEGLLGLSFKETGTSFSFQRDEYGYAWVVLTDPDFEDLVTNIQMICQILMEQGFGTQLLAAVYRFKGKVTAYWIYRYGNGVPAEGGDAKGAAHREGYG